MNTSIHNHLRQQHCLFIRELKKKVNEVVIKATNFFCPHSGLLGLPNTPSLFPSTSRLSGLSQQPFRPIRSNIDPSALPRRMRGMSGHVIHPQDDGDHVRREPVWPSGEALGW